MAKKQYTSTTDYEKKLKKVMQRFGVEEFKQGVNVVDGMCNVYQILHNIDTAPTIDAEPVVRCKDCRYREYIAGRMFCSKVYSLRVEENHYCSYGAKMDEEKVCQTEKK